MSLLQLYSTPAERARGASWADRFESQALVERNNGTVSGAPTFSPDGVVLDGINDYITYNLTGREFDSAEIAFVVDFTPDFAADDGVQYLILDDTTGLKYTIVKTTAGDLQVYVGGAAAAACLLVEYQSYWTAGSRIHLVFSGTTGANKLFLNGNDLTLVSPTTAWSPVGITGLRVGARSTAAQKFDGVIHRIQVYKTQLSAAECIDICNDTTYHYINEATLHLPFGAAEHDPGNVRTLDVSGNNAHAIFGDGSTPTTYPSKLPARHGYDYDGGDYLVAPATGLLNSVGITIAMEFWPDFETGVDAVHYLFDGPLTTEYAVLKHNNVGNNVLRVYLGNVTIENIAEATYSPFWRKGRRNLLLITGDSVNNLTNVWLNEGQILTDDATAWAPLDPASLYIGARYDASLQFDGKITHFEVFPSVLTAMQRANLTIRLARRVNRV